MKTRKSFVASVASACTLGLIVGVAAIAVIAPGSAYGGGSTKKYTVTLTGQKEVPPADSDGTGVGTVTVSAKKGQVCVKFKKVANIGAATMAHIHQAPVGVDGPIVVPLAKPVLVGKKYQKSKTCTNPGATLVNALANTPSGFYLNIHNAAFPGGAIRGQLG